MRKLLLLFSLALFVNCSATKDQKSQTKADGLVTIKIVQVNDVYEIDALNDGLYGGMARVAYIRDSIQKQNPNTYLFMGGDFLNPSLLGNIKVDGKRLQGKQMVDVMNAMDFDLVTFGNHEFDLKEDDLQARLNESQFDWVSANSRQVTPNGLQPFYSYRESGKVPVYDYIVYEVEDADGDKMKFGVIGVNIDSNPKDYVHYADVYEEAERTYNLAKDASDFVVGLTHVALDQDQKIAQLLPELPLIMGGHEHYNMLVKEGNTMIAKADANAKTVYVHTLTYNTKSKNLTLDSELVYVTDKTGSNPKVQKIVDEWSVLLEENLKEIVDNPNEVIYNAITPWDGTDESSRSKQTNLGEIITKAMVHIYKDDVNAAIVNGGSIRIDDALNGLITSKDIFRILLFGGEVVKVDLRGRLLSDVLNFGNQATGTGAYLQRHNFSKNSGGEWQIAGKNIDPSKTYTIAMTDFLLLGLDIPFLTADHEDIISVYRPKDTETAKDIRAVVIDYLKSL